MGRGWGSLLVLCALAEGAAAESAAAFTGDFADTATDVTDTTAGDFTATANDVTNPDDLFHGCEHSYDRMWPGAPTRTRVKMSLMVTDELTELGNTLGHHINALTNETVSLGFDGRKRRANFRIGLAEGPDRLLTFKLVGDVHFTRGRARASLKLDFGVGERVFHVELRELEVTHTEYRGDRGVALVIPFIKREF